MKQTCLASASREVVAPGAQTGPTPKRRLLRPFPAGTKSAAPLPSSGAQGRASRRDECHKPGESGVSPICASTNKRLICATLPACLLVPKQAGAAARFDAFLPLAPPEPVRIPRRTLEQRFAVLLMRSAYNSVDELDFMPMDEFQVKFWKLRQNEWEPYKLQYSPLNIRLGDLTDPLYFDFIQYAQYALLSREMPNGRQIFEEFCELEEECPEGRKRIVRRDPRLADNKLLPDAMERRIGDCLYDSLRNGFENIDFGGPSPCAPSASLEEVVEGVKRIVGIFVDRGYALKGEVEGVSPDKPGNGGRFIVRMEAPCNYWGLRRLGSIKAPLVNASDAMAIGAFMRASGRDRASYRLELQDLVVLQEWTVPPTA